ncbi:hypothetical protein C0991_009338 [Blastosporella zonata]|nr:hypothetical protein C0991_009338 [Blastosporella zonata]
MPAELTQAKLKRRLSRAKDLSDEYGHGGRFDAGHARELELKRNRGQLRGMSKAQDKMRQANSVSVLSGSLSTGQGTRFVLAATEHLHRRIGTLSARIRLLEDALTSLQASHPLLHPDLVVKDDLAMDEDENGDRGIENGERSDKPGGDVIDAFGTLSISDHGISRFFGPTGGVESLLISNLTTTPDPSSPLDSPHLTSASFSPSSTVASADPLALFSAAFPFTPLGSPSGVQALIASHLPPRATADALVHVYLQQCSWLFHGVTKGQIVVDMIPAIYSRLEAEREGNKEEGEFSGPHDLALVLIIFAIGALVRPSSSSATDNNPTSSSSRSHHSKATPPPAANPQHPNSSPASVASTISSSHFSSSSTSSALGEHYYHLARAALTLQPILEKPSLVTVQTLHLLSIYNAMSGSDLKSETSMEMTWSLITLAGHLSMTIGLHRDSARWGLTPKMVQRRRILFWDLFVADVWQSLNTGRPPSFSLAYIDCSFPDAKDGLEGSEGAEAGFGSAFSTWQCRFAAECVADVTARTLTAEAPTYATIMELDKKVREFPLPEGMDSAGGSSKGKEKQGEEGAQESDMAGSFQRCVLDHIRETVLMYIHRSFFAQAIIEHPANPLKSAYAPSFLAAYRAASTILKSVVFGTVVTRGPRSPLAQSAMGELEQACILFSKASVHSIRATKALPILSKLAEKARHALATAQKDPSSLGEMAGGLLWKIPSMKQEQDSDDELAIFAGHTRFVSSRKPLNSNPTSSLVESPVRTQPPPPPLLPSSGPVNGWPGPSSGSVGYINVSPTEELLPARNLHTSALPLPLPLHYPYASSERSTRNLELEPEFGPAPRGWEDDRPLHVQGYPHHQRQGSMQMMPPSRVVSSSHPQFYTSPAAHGLPPQHSQQTYRTQQHPLHAYAVHPHAHIQQFQHTYPQSDLQHQAYPQQQQQSMKGGARSCMTREY